MALYQFNGKKASFLFLDGRVIQNFIPLKMSYTIKDPKELHEFDSNFKYQIEVFEDNENYRVNIYSENDFEWFKCNIKTLTVDYLKLTNKVTDMSYMFSNCSLLSSLDLTNCDTSNVTNMSHIFENCTSLTSLDLTSFDTSNVTNMSYFFSGCSVSTNRNFNISKVEDMSYMYYNFGGKSTSGWHIDWSNSDTSSLTNTSHMFYGCKNVTKLNLSGWDTSNLSNYENMFYDLPSSVNWCYDGSNYSKWTLTEVDTGFSGIFPWNITYTVTVNYIDDNNKKIIDPYIITVKNKQKYDIELETNRKFKGYAHLEVQGELTGVATGNVVINDLYTNFNYVEYKIDNSSTASGLNTKPMNHEGTYPDNPDKKFYYYLPQPDESSNGWQYALLTLSDGTTTTDLSTPANKVERVRVYFYNNTTYFRFNCIHSKITEIIYMYTENFTTFEDMFKGSNYITKVDLTGWKTKNVTSMKNMFYSCNELRQVVGLEGLDVKNLTSTSYMFYDCDKLTGSLNFSWTNTDKIRYAEYMFYYCDSLREIDLSSWYSTLSNTRSMFDQCSYLSTLRLDNIIMNNPSSDYRYRMLKNVPSSVNWCYDGTNYQNWTLTEEQTGFSGTFPWNK